MCVWRRSWVKIIEVGALCFTFCRKVFTLKYKSHQSFPALGLFSPMPTIVCMCVCVREKERHILLFILIFKSHTEHFCNIQSKTHAHAHCIYELWSNKQTLHVTGTALCSIKWELTNMTKTSGRMWQFFKPNLMLLNSSFCFFGAIKVWRYIELFEAHIWAHFVHAAFTCRMSRNSPNCVFVVSEGKELDWQCCQNLSANITKALATFVI